MKDPPPIIVQPRHSQNIKKRVKNENSLQTHHTVMTTTHATQVQGPRRAFTSAFEVRRDSPPTAVRVAM